MLERAKFYRFSACKPILFQEQSMQIKKYLSFRIISIILFFVTNSSMLSNQRVGDGCFDLRKNSRRGDADLAGGDTSQVGTRIVNGVIYNSSRLVIERSGDTVVFTAKGDFDFLTSKYLLDYYIRREWDYSGIKKYLLDFQNVSSIDTAGIGGLMMLLENAGKQGIEFSITNIPLEIMPIMQMFVSSYVQSTRQDQKLIKLE